MLETKEQKQYFGIVIVLILSLIGVSFWNRTSFKFTDEKKYTQNNTDVELARKYLAYVNSLPIDKAASKDLFQTIITDQEIKQEVENALKSNQPLQLTQITEGSIKISEESGKPVVEKYLSETMGQAIDFNNKSAQFQTTLFTGDKDSLKKAQEFYSNYKDQLLAVLVPKEAESLHKDMILAVESYGRLLNVSENYDASDYTKNDELWPNVYQNYAAINEATKNYSSELTKLTGKYKIASISLPKNFAASQRSKIPFVKTAHAFLGIGDVTITVGDIPRIIMDAIKEGLRSAFVSFMGTMLNKLIAKIESNYMIANFLYYSDALVAGQYTDDYLNKYVQLQSDRQIIKRFIPQLSCGRNTADLRPVFEAKAKDYLGFTPENISPNDPDYYSKMAKVGDFMASPTGWQVYYQDIADQAKSEAEKNADRELNSEGLKAARDTAKNGLAKSVGSIVSAQRASFSALLQLGAQNAEGMISGFVSQLTQTLINNFVFKGVTGGPAGGVGVLKEQATCVAVAQIQPILALDQTQYIQPPPPPTVDEVYCQQNPSDVSCLPR